MKKIKKGAIVVVKKGTCSGNPQETITKVLSKPGRLDDASAKELNRLYMYTDDTQEETVLCKKDSSKKSVDTTLTCNNAPCFYEHLDDLRPASTLEKKLFKRNRNIPLKINNHARKN